MQWLEVRKEVKKTFSRNTACRPATTIGLQLAQPIKGN